MVSVVSYIPIWHDACFIFLFLGSKFSEAILAFSNMESGISPTNLSLRNQMKPFALQLPSVMLHYHKRFDDGPQGL